MMAQCPDIECPCNAPASRGRSGMFARLLDTAWERLPRSVRRIHAGAPVDARGIARVAGDNHWLARMLRTVAGLPEPAGAVELALEVRGCAAREKWYRRFGRNPMRSELNLSTRHANTLEERLGPARLTFALEVVDARLHWITREVRVLGVALPLRWFRGVCASCGEEQGRYAFDIDVRLPLVGRLVAYSGWLEPVDDAG